ncbi:MAG: alginate export family protein [Planctomycetota bacterium]
MTEHALPAPRRLAVASILSLVTLTGTALAQEPAREPLRLDRWLGTPDYLKVSGSHRTRYESLNGQFRNNTALRNNEDQLFNRSILRVDYSRSEFGGTVEGIDARAFNTKDNSFANTTTVNTLDLLQANASYAFGDGHKVTVGRYTMDIGSRRLSARNKYRNTINSFNGVRWDYKNDDSGYKAGAFWNMPTLRRPSNRAMLVDNEHDFDTQTIDLQFFGAHATTNIDENATLQVYLLGLDDDRGADQQLWTAGLRYYRPSQPGQVFGELEAAYQIGDRGSQDVEAHFLHASVGYTGEGDLQPSVRVAFDLATGNDGESGDYTRFNTLFGARRFEYGPTGIYGAIGRRNIISPEIRFSIRPTDDTWIMVAYRDLRLESGQDSWVEAGDSTGQGRRVGSQTECRLRWDMCKRNVRFETGAAYLAGGRFRETSAAGRRPDTHYFFFETIFTF